MLYAAAAVPAWWEQDASPKLLGGSLLAGAIVALALAVWRVRAPQAFLSASLVFGIAGIACLLVLGSGSIDYPEMPRVIGAVLYLSVSALAAGIGFLLRALQRDRHGPSNDA